jgi:hypothetical protein
MTLELVVNCPNCGAHKRTHNLADAPQVKKRIKLVQIQKAAKFRQEARAQRLKVKGLRPGKFKVSIEDLGADIEDFVRGWGRRLLAHGFDDETVHCVCGGVVRYELDDKEPMGVKLVDKTPPEKRRGKSHPASTEKP